ncbi:MAG: ATP-binding cassette domain-containing protein [Planctomycetota bacterium]
MRAILTAQGLAVGYGGEPLLEEIDFQVRPGEVFAILGGSGSGKTTLMRALIGLLPPLSGFVHIAGVGPPERGLSPPAFGVLFQSGALFGSMTLEQNVALPLRRWTDLPEDAISAVARARLRLVGLSGFENHLPSELSGGMRKRGGIARALALDPKLLFLDEPSAGLDPVTAAELDELILTSSRRLGVTIVLVTHELASIFRIADNCIVLDAGARGIMARGNPRELRETSMDRRVHAFFHRLPMQGKP